jgi:hypothetical protein
MKSVRVQRVIKVDKQGENKPGPEEGVLFEPNAGKVALALDRVHSILTFEPGSTPFSDHKVIDSPESACGYFLHRTRINMLSEPGVRKLCSIGLEGVIRKVVIFAGLLEECRSFGVWPLFASYGVFNQLRQRLRFLICLPLKHIACPTHRFTFEGVISLSTGVESFVETGSVRVGCLDLDFAYEAGCLVRHG